MKSKTGTIVATAIVTLAALVGGYYIGIYRANYERQPVAATVAADPASPARAVAAGIDPHAAINHAAGMPPSHPITASPPQEGRSHPTIKVDPSAKFSHFRVGQRNVKRIFADGEFMWVGTSGGVIRYNTRDDEYRLFDLRSGLLANGIFHIGRLQGRIVVGTYGGGMALHDAATDQWQVYNIPQGLGDAFVYDVLEADDGDVWIATWSGANRVRGGRLDDRTSWDLFTVENTDGGLPNDWVYALTTDRDGTVWFATEGGLARFKNGSWTNWQHADGLGAPFELVRDQIQFKNDPAEYSKHHARQKTEMSLEGVDVAYNPNYIIALVAAHDGTIWCGTWGGGLARFDGTKWRNFTVADGLPGNHVFSLHEDAEGRLWIGTSNGLATRDGNGFKTYTTADGLFSNTVFSMATASDGSSWVGSFGGVARIAKLQ